MALEKGAGLPEKPGVLLDPGGGALEGLAEHGAALPVVHDREGAQGVLASPAREPEQQ